MFYKGLILLIGIISGSQALAFQPSIEIIEKFDDNKVVAFIKHQDIQNYPLWNPKEGEPPLSISNAILAINNLTKGDELSNATIKEIELREIPHQKHLWHYLIKFKTNNTKSKYQIYVVLLNGKVIPAIIQPESFK